MNKNAIKTTLSLTIICVFAALFLGIVNHITAPVIAARQEADRAQKRQEVMAEADRFEPIENISDYDASGMVREGYIAMVGDEAIGYVFDVVSDSGFGGPIAVTVGVTNDLIFSGLRVGDNSETAGLGSRAAEPAFYDQFVEKSGDPALTVNGSSANNIDGITSATITSSAVTGAAQSAWNTAQAIQEEGA
ncbi:MAG TPA: FMN-binding protein [Clostridiaceae bacterium]|nr:FMN-binding protein [Clostridiaceae bacterium]